MKNAPLRVLAVVGSLNKTSVTRTVVTHLAASLKSPKCRIDLLDLSKEPMPMFNSDTSYHGPGYKKLRNRVHRADVLLLGTPDYHGSMSGVMKNFLDHFWTEFAGKLFTTVVASHEKGLTVTDQLRTVARQCYAWSLPYGLSIAEREDIVDGKITSDSLKNRMAMMARDIQVYGGLLSRQKILDLEATEPGFMARYRRKK
jgi:NAD(P)H-dependent FMN reductase